MVNFYDEANGGNGTVAKDTDNYYNYNYHVPNSLSWLDLRIFYVRTSKCEIDDDEDSTPEYLTLNHVQLNPDTLTEVNGVRTGMYSDAESILLRRDRVDKKSEEVTFVSTENIRTTGSVKFEVFRKDRILVLSGTLELCEERQHQQQQRWNIRWESDFPSVVEVYVAGCYSGRPIILTNAPQQIGHRRRKPIKKGMLETIPEYYEDSYGFNMQVEDESENEACEDHNCHPDMMEYLEGDEEEEEEDGELSWFNAGVRVGVGIGLSVCLGIGIGVGLVVKAYQGTTGNFRMRRRQHRRLF